MCAPIKTLLIGESWMVCTTETKGADTFSVSSYGVGTEYIKRALSSDGFAFSHMPCHQVSLDFPESWEGLTDYDVVLISDVGSNTFLLPSETFIECKKTPNKLEILKDYVLNGGGLCMVGGYLSFMGIEGKGKYHGSILEAVLPVDFQPCDDRIEHPEGLDIPIDPQRHPILSGMPGTVSGILGYNRATVKQGCEAIATIGEDPLLVLGEFGKGRSIAYASDLAPHWASPAFCESEAYDLLWKNIARWLSKTI